jgi:hypothetical protein
MNRSSRSVRLVTAVVFLAAVATAAPRARENPIGHVEVAYRQVADGKADKLVYLATLTCDRDLVCELSTLHLNFCLPSSFAAGASEAYAIGIEKSSTADGSLKVQATIEPGGKAATIIAEEEDVASAKITYRFEVALRNTVGGMGGPLMDKVTGFSGAAVKDSIVAKKIVSWTLEPLKGAWSVFEPDCKLILPGVPAK